MQILQYTWVRFVGLSENSGLQILYIMEINKPWMRHLPIRITAII